jgi:outer membrane protein with beta-barrel domain
MKKSIIVAVLCFFGVTQINAQVSFRPGIKAGLNASHFTQTDRTDEKFTSKTDFYAGVYGALKLTKIYTLQPELVYTRQGANREYFDADKIRRTETLDVSYLSIGVANKFTFKNFNFQVGPTIDIKVNDSQKNIAPSSEGDPYYEFNYNPYTGIDFAFFAGVGYDFTKNFGVEARIKKGLIPVNDTWGDYDDNYTNVVFQVGATYTFDIK